MSCCLLAACTICTACFHDNHDGCSHAVRCPDTGCTHTCICCGDIPREPGSP